MITDDDVKKLKKVFVRKDELRYLKEDLEATIERNTKGLVIKIEESKKETIKAIADFIQESITKKYVFATA